MFDDRAPHALYLPDGARVAIASKDGAEVGIAHAPGGGKLPPRHIAPDAMKRFARGQGTNTRYVCDILPATEPAEHLLVVEVVSATETEPARGLVESFAAGDGSYALVGSVEAGSVLNVRLTLERETYRLTEALITGRLQTQDEPDTARLIRLSGFDSTITIEPPV